MPLSTLSAISLRWGIRSVVGIFCGVFMPLWTMRNGSSRGRSCDSTSRSYIDSSLKILASGDRFKVRWVHAVANPAEMIQIETFRYRSDYGFVRRAMRQLGNAVRLILRPDADPCVTMRVDSTSPEPAAGRIDFNGLFDSFSNWNSRPSHRFDYRAFWIQQQEVKA